MAKRKQLEARAQAAVAVGQVLNDGRSIRNIEMGTGENDALISELVNGVLRWYWPLAATVDSHLKKPLRAKDADIYSLLLIGAYQIQHMRVPEHAAVSETVSACNSLSRPWATRLVNGVLRNIIRNKDSSTPASLDDMARWSHPQWLIDSLKHQWPDQHEAILEHGNQRPDMFIRVNRRLSSRSDYLARLLEAGFDARACDGADDAIQLLRPVGVDDLPGFRNGEVSVQDVSAQLVVDLVDPLPGERILDACAAPGGKSMHMLERCDQLENLMATDIDSDRVRLVRDNLARCKLGGPYVSVQTADAGTPPAALSELRYDKILVDAPCSGTGVISRHPDIKHLRLAEDVESLGERQDRILDAMWQMLNPGGRLIYVTCSILGHENSSRLQRFADHHPQANVPDPGEKFGLSAGMGRQRLPGVHSGDGFFYGVLENSTTVD